MPNAAPNRSENPRLEDLIPDEVEDSDAIKLAIEMLQKNAELLAENVALLRESADLRVRAIRAERDVEHLIRIAAREMADLPPEEWPDPDDEKGGD